MNKNQIEKNLHYSRSTSSEDIDLQGLFSTIWERKKLLIGIIALGTILTFFSSLLIKTNYTARSVILIENEGLSAQAQDITELAKTLSFDAGFILTEIEVLRSRNLISKIVQRLRLDTDPEFNNEINRKTDILETESTESTQSAQTIQSRLNDDTVSNVFKHLRVTSIPGSLAAKVTFSSKNAEKAALIANSFVDEYIKQRMQAKYDNQEKLAEWLDRRVATLRKQVLDAETKTEKYRVKNNLTAGKNNLLSAEEIAILNNQRILAQTHYQDLKAQYNQVRKGSGNTNAAATSLNAGLIKSLNIEKLALETNISELTNRYGPKHPTMIDKRAELSEIEAKINQQIEKSKQALKNDLAVAKAQLNDIEKTINETTGENNIDNSAMIQLRELEREANASQNILKSFLEKYKRSTDKNTLQKSGVRIISYANIPSEPSSPDKRLILALGIFLSTIIGLACVFISEKLFNKFRNAEELEHAFGFPCLNYIPYTHLGWGKDLKKFVASKPSSPITEAVRNLRINLKNQKGKNGKTPKVVAFMSSFKNEGKTTTAVLMASLAAKAGERVILIDANLRTPCVHTAIKESNDTNLVSYLTAQKDLTDVIHKDHDTNMDVIFGAAVPDNSFNLLSMNKLDTLITALRQSYDLVIIDTAACKDASDARLVEQLSDFSIFSVKYNSTKEKMIAQAIKPFQLHTNPSLGFILTFAR